MFNRYVSNILIYYALYFCGTNCGKFQNTFRAIYLRQCCVYTQNDSEILAQGYYPNSSENVHIFIFK